MTDNILNLNNLRLAVLIDAENIPRNCIKRVMEEIAIYGIPTIKRIYGDWTNPVVSGWKTSLLENAITPIQQYSYTKGKNSSDSAMIIDAMDILYSEKTDGFVIVSSDSDFTRLAIRLREAGQRVIGIGERKTPNAFIAACDKFTYIEVINKGFAEKSTAISGKQKEPLPSNEAAAKDGAESRAAEDGAVAEAGAAYGEKSGDTKEIHDFPMSRHHDSARTQPGKPSAGILHFSSGTMQAPAGTVPVPVEIVELIAGSVADLAGDSGSVFMGELGNLLLKKQPDFDHRNFGFKSLSAMIKSIGRFEIEFRHTTDPNIKHVFVRDKEA